MRQMSPQWQSHQVADVLRWLHSPINTRGFPDRGPGSYMAGGTLAQWFDVIIHRQKLTPAQPT
jgi:erythromycin esterase